MKLVTSDTAESTGKPTEFCYSCCVFFENGLYDGAAIDQYITRETVDAMRAAFIADKRNSPVQRGNSPHPCVEFEYWCKDMPSHSPLCEMHDSGEERAWKKGIGVLDLSQAVGITFTEVGE